MYLSISLFIYILLSLSLSIYIYIYMYIYIYIYIYKSTSLSVHVSLYIYLFIPQAYIISLHWRRDTCYSRRKWTRKAEFKSWTSLFTFHFRANDFGKGMNS